MKLRYILIILAVGALIMFLIMKGCEKPVIPDRSGEIKTLVSSIEARDDTIKVLKRERDSLLAIPPQIEQKIVYRLRQIDENIAEDSTRARVEFNQALTENSVLPDPIPDNPHYVSFRDLGNSAKLMSKIPKLELQIKTYKEITLKDLKIQEEYDSQIKGYKDLGEIKDLEIQKYMQLYKDESSFWKGRLFGFTLGVAGTLILVFATGSLK